MCVSVLKVVGFRYILIWEIKATVYFVAYTLICNDGERTMDMLKSKYERVASNISKLTVYIEIVYGDNDNHNDNDKQILHKLHRMQKTT